MELSTCAIKKLFERQISELTKRSLNREELFDFQLSGGWLI